MFAIIKTRTSVPILWEEIRLTALAFNSLCSDYSTEEACIQALFQARWPNGFRCPACGHSNFYTVSSRRLPLYQCASPYCRHQTSITAGTIMEGSRTPLTLWFRALFLLSQISGISSFALSNILKITYKTAWLITHKIRHAMKREEADYPLTGNIRVETFYYGSPLYSDARQPLLLGGAEDECGDPIQIKIHQPNPDHVELRYLSIHKHEINSFIEEHTNGKSVVIKNPYAMKNSGFNRIQRHVTSWLNDTFRGIGPKHLQAYLHEYCFRWNKQGLCLRDVFSRALAACASTPVLIYRELTRFRPVLPRPWHAFSSKSKWRGWHLTRWGH
ncbi:IS1595 family transposase [Cohnella thailandensis]|uniref:IS1595 family transposase n=1 Tax=Cohnella thailandensis TaxID=557557 RepID=A0A841T3F0_9BACL|nr:IS1595 family transposase [Cohnella thailandensis]